GWVHVDRSLETLHVLGRREPGAAPEHDEVRQRVAAETIGPMHSAGDFTHCEEARHAGGLGIGVDAHATHDVVTGRTDLHRLLGDVAVRKLFELVVHGWQALRDVVGRAPGRDVEEHTAVRAAPPRFDFAVDGAGDLVTREQVRRPPVVLLVLVPGIGLLLV